MLADIASAKILSGQLGSATALHLISVRPCDCTSSTAAPAPPTPRSAWQDPSNWTSKEPFASSVQLHSISSAPIGTVAVIWE